MTENGNGKKHRASAMSALWGLFLEEEDKNSYDHTIIAGLSFQETAIEIDTLRELIYEKMVQANLPRYKSIVRFENGIGYFYELEGSDIDMNYDENEDIDLDDLYDWVGRQYDYENRLDINKPLWRVLTVPRLTDGRSVMILVVNHMLGDGMSQLAIYLSLTDYVQLPNHSQQGAKGSSHKDSEMSILERLRVFGKGVYYGLGLGPKVEESTNPLTSVSRRRITGITDKIPVEKVKEISRKLGGRYTVNDILLTLMNLTLVEYFREVDASILAKDKDGQTKNVTATFPINLRPKGFDFFKEGTGNIVFTGSLRYVFDYESRIDLLETLKKIFDEYKVSPQPMVGKRMLDTVLFNTLKPESFKSLIHGLYRKSTSMLSNVKGPSEELSILGSKVVDMQFFALSAISLYFGILSYNGWVNATFVLDPAVEPNPNRLAKYWKIEFDQLYEEAMEI